MKNTDGKDHDVNDYYHHSPDRGYESRIEQTGQIAGDCVAVSYTHLDVYKRQTMWCI